METLGKYRDSCGQPKLSRGIVILPDDYAMERMPQYRTASRIHSALGVVEVSGGETIQNHRNSAGRRVPSLGIVFIEDSYDGAPLPWYRTADGQRHSATGVIAITDENRSSALRQYRGADGELYPCLGVVELNMDGTLAEDEGGGEEYEGPLDLVPGAFAAYAAPFALRAAMLGQDYLSVTKDPTGTPSTEVFALDAVTGLAPTAAIDAFLGEDGSACGGVYDHGTNGLNLTAAGIAPPVWSSDGVESKPAFAARGVVQGRVENIGNYDWSEGDPVHIFIVATMQDGASGSHGIRFRDSNNQDTGFVFDLTGGVPTISVFNPALFVSGVFPGVFGTHIYECAIDAAGVMTGRVDGVSQVITQEGDPEMPIPAFVDGEIALTFTTTGSQSLTSAAIVYKGISAGDATLVREWLATAFGITLP